MKDSVKYILKTAKNEESIKNSNLYKNNYYILKRKKFPFEPELRLKKSSNQNEYIFDKVF